MKGRRVSAELSTRERRNLKHMVVSNIPTGLSVLPRGQQIRGNDIVIPRGMTVKDVNRALWKPRLF